MRQVPRCSALLQRGGACHPDARHANPASRNARFKRPSEGHNLAYVVAQTAVYCRKYTA